MKMISLPIALLLLISCVSTPRPSASKSEGRGPVDAVLTYLRVAYPELQRHRVTMLVDPDDCAPAKVEGPAFASVTRATLGSMPKAQFIEHYPAGIFVICNLSLEAEAGTAEVRRYVAGVDSELKLAISESSQIELKRADEKWEIVGGRTTAFDIAAPVKKKE